MNRYTKFLILSLAVFLVVEISVRTMSQRIGPNMLWFDSLWETKALRYRSLVLSETKPNSIIFGTSITAAAIKPETVMRAIGSKDEFVLFNAAQPGTNYKLAYDLYFQIYSNMHATDTVILGVALIEFNENVNTFFEQTQSLIEDPHYKEFITRDYINFSLTKSTASVIAQYKFNLQLELYEKFSRPIESEYITAYGSSVRPGTSNPIEDTIPKQVLGLVQPYSWGGDNVDHLKKFVNALKDDQKEVIIANMPISPVFWRLIKGFDNNTYQTYYANMTSLCRKLDVRFIDLNQKNYQENQFIDPIHVNAKGAEVVSSLLAKKLKAASK